MLYNMYSLTEKEMANRLKIVDNLSKEVSFKSNVIWRINQIDS